MNNNQVPMTNGSNGPLAVATATGRRGDRLVIGHWGFVRVAAATASSFPLERVFVVRLTAKAYTGLRLMLRWQTLFFTASFPGLDSCCEQRICCYC